MEHKFWLHPNTPLTVEVIQNILAQRVAITHLPVIEEAPTLETATPEEILTPAELQQLAIGLGSETPAELKPLLLLLLADFFTKNPVPTNSKVISRILEFYDYEVWPQIFTQGLNASPTAHLILPVFGAGKVYYQGYLLNAADVHDIFSWEPVPWPEKFPIAFSKASLLSLSNVLFSFIQFEKIFSYSQTLLPPTAFLPESENLFREQILNLEAQLNNYLASPDPHSEHVNGLVYQVLKLISKFGNQVFESVTQTLTRPAFTLNVNINLTLNSVHLLALLEVLSQENSFLFDGNLDSNSGTSTAFTNRLMMQPYLFLNNLEKMLAIVTIIQLTATTNQENSLNVTADLRNTYRKQVIDVLKEAIFDELIRKTIAFMYARVSSN